MTTNQPDADLVSRIVAHRLVMTGSGWGCHKDSCDWALDDDDAVLAVAWREFAAHLARDVLAPYIAEREARLRSLVEALAIGGIPTFDENGIGIDHSLRVEEHGDGYQEPMEESWSCECEEWGINWVQTDPACTGRPVTLDVAFEWMDHVDRAAQHRSKP